MIVQICGNLIKTDFIYKIGDIKETESSSLKFYFEIDFVNEKYLTIFSKSYEVLGKQLGENIYLDDEVKTKERRLKIKEQIEKIRDRLARIWLSEQSDMIPLEFPNTPKLEFDLD